eukprot:TRINITY_DN8127_c0_g1_i1.p1 TRINITY_DN8127_c0_g1~~TRINITY_DN8127_c0_g1_i1.p1  ORF type:complete len:815 (-),score=73.95 TRINITY_DN8127_c0_g1_i1:2234-4678(-)
MNNNQITLSKMKCTHIVRTSIMQVKEELERKLECLETYPKETNFPVFSNWIVVSHIYGSLYAMFGDTIMAVKPENVQVALFTNNTIAEFWAIPSTYNDLLAGIFLSPCELYLAVAFTKRKELDIIPVKDILYSVNLDINYCFDFTERGQMLSAEWFPIAEKIPSFLVAHSTGAITLKRMDETEIFRTDLNAEYATFTKDPVQILVLVKGKNEVLVLDPDNLVELRKVSITIPNEARLYWVKETNLGMTLFVTSRETIEEGKVGFTEEVYKCNGKWHEESQVDLSKCALQFAIAQRSENNSNGNDIIIAELPQAKACFIGTTKNESPYLLTKEGEEWNVTKVDKLQCYNYQGRQSLLRGIAVYDCKLSNTKATPVVLCNSEGDIDVFCVEFPGFVPKEINRYNFESVSTSLPPALKEEEKMVGLNLGGGNITGEQTVVKELLPPEKPRYQTKQETEEILNQAYKLIRCMNQTFEDYAKALDQLISLQKKVCSKELLLEDESVKRLYETAASYSNRLAELWNNHVHLKHYYLYKTMNERDIFLGYHSNAWRKRYYKYHLIDRDMVSQYKNALRQFHEISKEAYKLTAVNTATRDFNSHVLITHKNTKKSPQKAITYTEKKQRPSFKYTSAQKAPHSKGIFEAIEKPSPAKSTYSQYTVKGEEENKKLVIDALNARISNAERAIVELRKSIPFSVSKTTEKSKAIRFSLAEELEENEIEEQNEWISLHKFDVGERRAAARNFFSKIKKMHECKKAETMLAVPDTSKALDVEDLFGNSSKQTNEDQALKVPIITVPQIERTKGDLNSITNQPKYVFNF